MDLAIRQVFERTTVADLAERHRKRLESPVWAPSELLRPAKLGRH